MKRRRFRPLVPATLERLGECQASSMVARGGDATWARAAADLWGLCGVVAVEDDQLLAHLLVCPTLYVPSPHPLAQWSRTPETAAILELHVEPQATKGTDRHLVQSIAARLHGQVGGIEAAGARQPAGCDWLCIDWAETVGFVALDRHVGSARLRLDLTSAITWRPGLRSAWGLLSGWVEHPLSPEPSSRELGRAGRR